LDQDDIIDALTGYLEIKGHEGNFIITLEVKKNESEYGNAYIISAHAEEDE